MEKIISSIMVLIGTVFIAAVVAGIVGSFTTITTMTNGDQTFRFYGVLHMGSTVYWEWLENKINSHKSYVLYEAVREKDKLWMVLKPFKDLSFYASTKFQGDEFNYHSDWVLSDITPEKLHSFYPQESIDFLQKSVDSMKNTPYVFVRILVGINILWERNLGSDPLVTERNIKPVLDTLAAFESYDDVSLVYGELHGHGIIQRMKNHGFRVTSVEYKWPY